MFRIRRTLGLPLGLAILLSGVSVFSVTERASLAHGATMMQDVRASLFGEADQAMQQAQKARADILAPKSYREGLKLYREAAADFKKGRKLDDIRKKLRGAVSYFNKAREATKLAAVTFTSPVKARSDARNAEAPKYAPELWGEAESKFREAAVKLEDGDVNSAKRKASEAEKLYRQAELNAIKVNYLNETWELLRQADELKVKDYAPKTLQRATELIKQAEKELNENRYDTDVARGLAQQAKYEVKHAIYLASTIREMKKSKQSLEDMLLASERPLSQIAAALDVVATFDTGMDKPTAEILAYINAYQDSVRRMSQLLAERQQEVGILQERIAEMESQLGGIEKEKSALARRIEEQAKIREQFASVEKLFRREEAIVLRDGNDVILRLIGLNFAVGKSSIDPQYFALLTKVQQAIRTFPECTVTVEGHTDSYGSDEANLLLSQERAEAVRQYLLANMGLAPARIEAVGFGESKPIANNETPEGRTKNRRIEVVIHPHMAGTY